MFKRNPRTNRARWRTPQESANADCAPGWRKGKYLNHRVRWWIASVTRISFGQRETKPERGVHANGTPYTLVSPCFGQWPGLLERFGPSCPRVSTRVWFSSADGVLFPLLYTFAFISPDHGITPSSPPSSSLFDSSFLLVPISLPHFVPLFQSPLLLSRQSTEIWR